MRSDAKKQNGFSMLEVLISVLIMTVVSGSAFYAANYFQKNAVATQLRMDMHSSMRAALELMTQEIGQAGLLSFNAKTTSAAITANLAAQTVALSSTADIFVGEKLLVDVDILQEIVAVTNKTSTTISAIFTKNHASGVTVNAIGAFPQGILWSSGGTLSTATRLEVVGDLLGDGSLVYVQYNCDTAAGTLSRSVTSVSAAGISASVPLVQNLTANPGGTACFQYTTTTASGFTFVTSVAVTMSVQTQYQDPQTKSFVTMTKSFLNIAPRNVLAALAAAQASLTDRLQPTPTNLPLT